jgi:hypothetical protein
MNDKTQDYEDGPAVIYPNGEKQWWQHDYRHRDGGPAIVFGNGNRLWFFNGQQLSKRNFTSIEMIKRMKAYGLFTPKELIRMKLDAKV